MKNEESSFFMKSFALGVFVILLTFTVVGVGWADDSEKAIAGVGRWSVESDGSILWNVAEDKELPHNDHIEMSGEQVSTVFRYGVTAEGEFTAEAGMVWPMLRMEPNETHSSLMRRFPHNPVALVNVNNYPLKNESVKSISFRGILTVTSEFPDARGTPMIRLTRNYFPSTTHPLFCERFMFQNLTDGELTVEIPEFRTETLTDREKGVNGSYHLVVSLSGAGCYRLAPGESIGCDVGIQGFSPEKGESEFVPDYDAEERARSMFVGEMWDNLVFESPDPVLNAMFAFAKIRVCESIYRTAGGPMHGPGGESYYAAIWANDQAEYVNPFFPWLGYRLGNESALNSFHHFMRFMNDRFEPIPSSIISEGISIWNGAGDRGDAAMIAYGASRYALTRGDRSEAEELWPLIEWCLEYCRLKLNDQGVVRSDCDELERRFPAGDANLSTSSLYYDALLSAAYLGTSLGKPESTIEDYRKRAETLRERIEDYFGHEMAGFHTYWYYEGNDLLRSWICMPLVVGITDRAEGTVGALFSNRLWTPNGLLTQEGTKTYWDRSTLYALRGVFYVGAKEEALDHFARYSRYRLLGNHVPYAVEAWPEGSQRHLSAESGLYCRVVTEGIFGFRPTGLNSLEMTPRLPSEWERMSLRRIHGFGTVFDVDVTRADPSEGETADNNENISRLNVTITTPGGTSTYLVREGEPLSISF